MKPERRPSRLLHQLSAVKELRLVGRTVALGTRCQLARQRPVHPTGVPGRAQLENRHDTILPTPLRQLPDFVRSAADRYRDLHHLAVHNTVVAQQVLHARGPVVEAVSPSLDLSLGRGLR